MNRRTATIGAVVLPLALASAAFAQAGPGAPKAPAAEDRLTSDVWVRVVLKTGAEIEGLATGGVHYEKLDKGRFVPARPETDRDAGLKLHFADYNEGFVFVRARDVLEIRSEKPLTIGEGAAIRALVKRRQEASASAAGAAAAGGSGRAASTPGAPASLAPTVEGWRKALFEKFPPSAGWGPAKRDDILRKRWTVGVFPDALEREFLDHFEDWMVEYEKSSIEEPSGGSGRGEAGEKPLPPPPPPAPSPGDDARRENGAGRGENASGHGDSPDDLGTAR